jgi:hypothetical protein
MPTLALRAIQTALAAALLLSIGDVVLAQLKPAPAIAEDQRMLPYVEPGQLVDIGGRRINLHCTGADGPTVILMAGIFSWSVVWYIYAVPMMFGAAHFWLVRKGFYIAAAGGELPIVWGVMLIVQAMLGDGIWALRASDTPILSSLRRRTVES